LCLCAVRYGGTVDEAVSSLKAREAHSGCLGRVPGLKDLETFVATGSVDLGAPPPADVVPEAAPLENFEVDWFDKTGDDVHRLHSSGLFLE
jgi:hypothetical protein